MRHVVVVGAAKSLILQVLLALHTHEQVRCTVVHPPGLKYMRLSRLCAERHELDLDGPDDDKCVELVNAVHRQAPDAVLINVDCPAMRMIHRVRHRLRIPVAPCPDPATLDILDNKWEFYKLCRRLQLSVPPTLKLSAEQPPDYQTVAQALGVPFLVKPLNQDSSRGIYCIADEAEYVKRVIEHPDREFGPLIAQQYIAGHDIGLDLCAKAGRLQAFAAQQRIDPRHDGSRIRFFHDPRLEDIARIIVAATSFDGVMNIDARIEEDTGKVFLFEANPRFWRSLSAAVWCGLNFAAECLDSNADTETVRVLDSGTADTYYHPVFKPFLWRTALVDQSHCGRMTRLMAGDAPILFMSAKILWERAVAQRPARKKIMENVAPEYAGAIDRPSAP